MNNLIFTSWLAIQQLLNNNLTQEEVINDDISDMDIKGVVLITLLMILIIFIPILIVLL